ncbi:MAG: Ig-like domain-containing protein [Caldilineaceae bacterium]
MGEAPDDLGDVTTLTGSARISAGNDVTATNDTCTASVTVNGRPSAPAVAITATSGVSLSFDALLSATDPDGDLLAIDHVSMPTHGHAASDDGRMIVYVPDTRYVGSDAFTYTVGDGFGAFDTAPVAVMVVADRRRTYLPLIVTTPPPR